MEPSSSLPSPTAAIRAASAFHTTAAKDASAALASQSAETATETTSHTGRKLLARMRTAGMVGQNWVRVWKRELVGVWAGKRAANEAKLQLSAAAGWCTMTSTISNVIYFHGNF